MANLTSARNVKQMGQDVVPEYYSLPVLATKIIQPGALVATDNAGNCVAAGDAAARIVVGVYRGTFAVDNTGSLSPAPQCNPIRAGVFNFANSAGGDAIAVGNMGQSCFVVDDHTVALTDNNGARIYAGTVITVDADGVWVMVWPEGAGAIPGSLIQNPPGVIQMSIPLAAFAVGGGTAASFTPQFGGRIKAISYSTTLVGAGAGATFALTVKIAGVTVTGGGFTITLANQTQGADAAGAAVTALNTFAANQAITLVNAAGTVFTSGHLVVNIWLG